MVAPLFSIEKRHCRYRIYADSETSKSAPVTHPPKLHNIISISAQRRPTRQSSPESQAARPRQAQDGAPLPPRVAATAVTVKNSSAPSCPAAATMARRLLLHRVPRHRLASSRRRSDTTASEHILPMVSLPVGPLPRHLSRRLDAIHFITMNVGVTNCCSCLCVTS